MTPASPGAGGEPDDPAARLSSTTHDPQSQSLADWTLLHEAVERLPANLRDVFRLRYYEGQTHEEVADRLGQSVTWVRRQWRNARLQLEVELRETTP